MDAGRPRPYAIAPMGRLEGRAIMVTGASSGIGRAVARRCASEGANVLATGRNEAHLAELTREHPSIAVHPADLTEAGAADGCAGAAVGRVGRLDGLVHAAGIVRRGEDIRSTTDDQWAEMRDINLDATFRLARACLREMVPRRSGSRVLVGTRARPGGGARLDRLSPAASSRRWGRRATPATARSRALWRRWCARSRWTSGRPGSGSTRSPRASCRHRSPT